MTVMHWPDPAFVPLSRMACRTAAKRQPRGTN